LSETKKWTHPQESKPINGAARRHIDEANQAWIKGLLAADPLVILETYAEDAVDCTPTGECFRSRAAILRRLKARVKKLGPARSASVTSEGAVHHGVYIFEWGTSTALFAGADTIGGNYLTVWRLETDGRWRIFRNIAL